MLHLFLNFETQVLHKKFQQEVFPIYDAMHNVYIYTYIIIIIIIYTGQLGRQVWHMALSFLLVNLHNLSLEQKRRVEGRKEGREGRKGGGKGGKQKEEQERYRGDAGAQPGGCSGRSSTPFVGRTNTIDGIDKQQNCKHGAT